LVFAIIADVSPFKAIAESLKILGAEGGKSFAAS
jgi:hypothetical protein